VPEEPRSSDSAAEAEPAITAVDDDNEAPDEQCSAEDKGWSLGFAAR